MISLYIKSNPICPFCVNAKAWLITNKFDFQTIDVTTDPKALEFIKSRGHMTVPQLYLGETLLVEGGYTGMTKLGAVALREKIGG